MKSGFSAAEYNTFDSTFSLIKIPGDFSQRYLRKPVQNNFRIVAIGAAKIAAPEKQNRADSTREINEGILLPRDYT